MCFDRIPKTILKYKPKGKKRFGKTSETMERFCFVISVTYINMPNTRKND
jgi:hypothetical protein